MKKVLLFIVLFLITINVKAEGLVTYLSLDDTGKIVIDVSNNFSIQEIDGEIKNKIEITNIDEYRSIFLGFDKSRYPIYITKSSNQYSFSKTQKKGYENYILISEIYNLSTSIKDSNINTCDALLGYKFVNLLKNNVFKIVYYAIPVILIVISSWDFFKLVFIEDKEGVPGAFRRLLKRAYVSIIIFLIPTILIFITNIFGNEEVKSCVNTFKTTENINK